MLQSEVEVGKIYACKVSGKIQPVKIVRQASRLRYGYRNAPTQRRKYLVGVNQWTDRQVETTAGKCRFEVEHVSGRKYREVVKPVETPLFDV